MKSNVKAIYELVKAETTVLEGTMASVFVAAMSKNGDLSVSLL